MAEVQVDAAPGGPNPRRRATDIAAPWRGFLTWSSFSTAFILTIIYGLLLLWQGPVADAALAAAATTPSSGSAHLVPVPAGFGFAKSVAAGVARLVQAHSGASSLLTRPSLQAGLWLLAPMLFFTLCLLAAALAGLEWPIHSFYYLGFLFTLASLFSAFGKFAPDPANATPQPLTGRIHELLGMAGSALSTTFAGLILRYIAHPLQSALIYWSPLQSLRMRVWRGILATPATLRAWFLELGRLLRSHRRQDAVLHPKLVPIEEPTPPLEPEPPSPSDASAGPCEPSPASDSASDFSAGFRRWLLADGLQDMASRIIRNFSKNM